MIRPKDCPACSCETSMCPDVMDDLNREIAALKAELRSMAEERIRKNDENSHLIMENERLRFLSQGEQELTREAMADRDAYQAALVKAECENERLRSQVVDGIAGLKAMMEARKLREVLTEALDWLCQHSDALSGDHYNPGYIEAWKRGEVGGRIWCGDCHNSLRSPADATLVARINEAIGKV